MTKIYIAGPLFSEAELKYNLQLDHFLSNLSYKTFLPQRDGYKLADLLLKGIHISTAMDIIFKKDLDEIKNSDIIVFIMDGREPDEGACFEKGNAYALGKECIGIKTDSRALMQNLDNPLIVGALDSRIARNFQDLRELLFEIKIQVGADNRVTNKSECCAPAESLET
jgi:nucleoside 2-deoxyribosyltransferase